MINKNNVDNQISRMKELMSYGKISENKEKPFSALEYQKKAADGNIYGIVREGTKYYIKACTNGKGLVNEDYDYIGGFRNRKNNEFSSYAMALKQFDMKMSMINEANSDKAIISESWNPEAFEDMAVESTQKMKEEIRRQRQIVRNVEAINENKEQECCGSNPFCVSVDEYFKDSQKNNLKASDVEPKGAKKAKKSKKVNESSSEVLAWNREDEDYMDTSDGTEIGDGAPFDTEKEDAEMENGVVEGKAMHNSQDMNTPEVGTNGREGAKDVDKPFNGEDGRQIDEEEEVEDTDVEDEDFDVDDEIEDADAEDDEPIEEPSDDEEEVDYEIEAEPESKDSDVEARLNKIEDTIAKIADKLGVGEFEDDDLYKDEEEIDDDEDFEDDDDDFEDDEDEDDEDYDVFESKSYRNMKLQEAKRKLKYPNDDDEDDLRAKEIEKKYGKKDQRNFRKFLKKQGIFDSEAEKAAMEDMSNEGKTVKGKRVNEDRLDVFGKHPAYRKRVMTLPTHRHEEFPKYYDMNDESAKLDEPYGQQIGDGAPFEIDVDKITNSIAESIKRALKKK